MSQFATCERGCTEQKLELVPADHYDRLAILADNARIRTEAFRAVADEFASHQPGPGEWEGACRSGQQAALIALRRYPDDDPQEEGWDEHPALVTTWWCPGCGSIDAPQPCLGICIWRRVEWVNASLHERQRASTVARRDAERRLRLLVRLVAAVTPRDGQWERGWVALAARAREALRHG